MSQVDERVARSLSEMLYEFGRTLVHLHRPELLVRTDELVRDLEAAAAELIKVLPRSRQARRTLKMLMLDRCDLSLPQESLILLKLGRRLLRHVVSILARLSKRDAMQRDRHAKALYLLAFSYREHTQSRCLYNLVMEQLAKEAREDGPCGWVYGVRLALERGEAFRRCWGCDLSERDLVKAADQYEFAWRLGLKLTRKRKKHKEHAVPGILFSAKFNLWLTAIEAHDWAAVLRHWNDLKKFYRDGEFKGCEDTLPRWKEMLEKEEFAPHIELWARSSSLSQSDRELFKGLLNEARAVQSKKGLDKIESLEQNKERTAVVEELRFKLLDIDSAIDCALAALDDDPLPAQP